MLRYLSLRVSMSSRSISLSGASGLKTFISRAARSRGVNGICHWSEGFGTGCPLSLHSLVYRLGSLQGSLGRSARNSSP